MHESTSESSECDFVLLELLTLVASRNTTLREGQPAKALLAAHRMNQRLLLGTRLRMNSTGTCAFCCVLMKRNL